MNNEIMGVRPLCPDFAKEHTWYDSGNSSSHDSNSDDEEEIDLLEYPSLYMKTEHELDSSKDFRFRTYRMQMERNDDHIRSAVGHSFLKLFGQKNTIQTQVHHNLNSNANLVKPLLNKWYILSLKLQGLKFPIERNVESQR